MPETLGMRLTWSKILQAQHGQCSHLIRKQKTVQKTKAGSKKESKADKKI